MHRIDDPTAVPTLPAPRAQGTPGYFTGGSPGSSGFAATVVRYEFMNALQEELSNVIEGSGITLNKTDNTQLLQALNRLFVSRTLVTQDTTLYVNPSTGNDSNNGLTSGTAFLTIQAAIYAAYSRFDWNRHNCTIQLADGTYNVTVAGTYGASFAGVPFGQAPFQFHINGNQPSPQNVRIVATNANCFVVNSCYLSIAGITFTATGNVNTIYSAQGRGLELNNAAWVDVQNCIFQSCGGGQVIVQNGAVLTLQGTGNQFSGTTPYSLGITVGGEIWFPGATFNCTGLTVANGFVLAQNAGIINGASASFIGSVTGPRYSVTQNGVINTSGGGANYFPGSIAGSTGSGGQYL